MTATLSAIFPINFQLMLTVYFFFAFFFGSQFEDAKYAAPVLLFFVDLSLPVCAQYPALEQSGSTVFLAVAFFATFFFEVAFLTATFFLGAAFFVFLAFAILFLN
jgi:hypothetical protein